MQIYRRKPRLQTAIKSPATQPAFDVRGSFPRSYELLGHVRYLEPATYSYLITFVGYKFETLSVLPDQWDPTSRHYIEAREGMVVRNYAQYCSVVKTGIGKAKMIIGGEVDARRYNTSWEFMPAHDRSVWDCKPSNRIDPINWVELKTSADIENDRDKLKYERKLLKFWIQSFLLGVPKIIVGFRNKNGILQRLEELETKSIPTFVKKQGKGTWDGNVCINFTASFLDCTKARTQLFEP